MEGFLRKRICKKCGQEVNLKLPDPCLEGFLTGIAQACCGHGEDSMAYCVGWPGCSPGDGNYSRNIRKKGAFEYRGKKAIEYMESLIEGPS